MFDADKGFGGEKNEGVSKNDKVESLHTVLAPVSSEIRNNGEKYFEYLNKIAEETKKLKDQGIDVEKYTKVGLPSKGEESNKELGKRKRDLRQLINKAIDDEPWSEEEKKIAETINLSRDDVAGKKGEIETDKGEPVRLGKPWEEELKRIELIKDPVLQNKIRGSWLIKNTTNANIPFSVIEEQSNKLATPDQLKGADRGRREPFEIKTEDDLNAALGEMDKITDPVAKVGRLGRLANYLYDTGKLDWANQVSEVKTKQQEKKNVANIEGLPKDISSKKEWRKWTRARLASLLDPTVTEVRSPRDVFGVVSETAFGRQPIDGTVYMPSDLRDELVSGKMGSDGRIETTSELQVSQEIGKLYTDWREAHKKLGFMVAAIDGGKYRLPSNDLNSRLLNSLKSEDGRDPEGGSKKIAKAVQIYWGMAHSKEEEGQKILENFGLTGIRNIFDSQLTTGDVGDIREKIADKVGGTYYENIGLMYASFYGVSAYGSDSTLPGIEYCDAMGNLVHSEINRYKNDNERNNSTRRGYRYLDDMVANMFYEVKEGKHLVKDDGSPVPIELSVHSGTLQDQAETKEPRAFYLLREKGAKGKFRMVKKIGLEGTDYAIDTSEKFMRLDTNKYEEVLFENLIKEGRINEIDWAHSQDISRVMVSREKGAIYVYKMYKNLDDDPGKLTDAALIARRENFEDAIPQYNLETQQHAMYLWLHSLINKNDDWLKTKEKKDEVIRMVASAEKHKLVSSSDANNLRKGFGLGLLGSYGKLLGNEYGKEILSSFGDVFKNLK